MNAERAQLEHSPRVRVYTAGDYLLHLYDSLPLVKQRVILQAMSIRFEDEGVADLVPIFDDRLARGVSIELCIDSFVSMKNGLAARLLFQAPDLNDNAKNEREVQDHLVARGVNFNRLNSPDWLARQIRLYKRNHIKFGVLDDTLYLGGVNLTRKITGSLDFMVAIDDPEMVHGFDDFRKKYKMADTDLQYDLNAENKFLYDAGRFNSSLIMKTANEMAGRAHSEIKVFCPFYVQGPFKKALLKAADRGCHVEIYTNGVSALHPPYRQFISYTGIGDRLERHRKIDIYRTENEMLHARGIIVDGKEALITSHTLSVAEQLLKTQNIALHTRQRNIVNPLLDYSYYGIKAACLEIQ